MTLILIIDVIVVGVLVGLTLTRGLERALPFFVFVVVLVPWQSKIVITGLFDLTTQRIALIILIGLYILTRMRKPRTHTAEPVPLKFLILLSIGWLFLSTINSVVPAISLKIVLSEMFSFYVLYIILLRTISSTETVHRILFGIVAALMVCAVLGVGEANWGWYVNDWFPQVASRFGDAQVAGGERGLRIQATFPHPIHYGAALAIGIPLALYLISVSKSVFRRGLLWAGILLMTYNIFMTGSRGPWLALGLSLPFVFLLCRGKLRWYFPAIALVCLFVLLGRPSVRNHLVEVFNATMNSNTVMGHSFEYRHALFNVAEHALAASDARAMWGYGTGSFYYLDLRGPLLGRPDWPFRSCDSTWIQLLVEDGYIGLVIMAMLLLTPAFLTFRDYRRFEKSEAPLSGVLLVNLVAFYFMMISVAMYSWAQMGYLLWILIGLSLSYGRLVRQSWSAVSLDSIPNSTPEFVTSDINPVVY